MNFFIVDFYKRATNKELFFMHLPRNLENMRERTWN
jgi:hypothetical protein